jgi:formylglycine-generating enzyme required for sulfatase activity
MFTAKVVFWRPVHPNPSTQAEFQEDIAALELSVPLPEAVRPVQLVTSEDLWGHPFRVLGFPDGKQNGAWASGELRAPIASGWVQLEDVKGPGYRLEEGFSGAPVWDEKLQAVVGMAVAAEKKRIEAKAAFIIPTSLLVKAWHELSEQAIPSCPYRGLFAFQEEDAPFFCGRETFTEQLLVAVQKKPLVAVIGASGSGKSSVVFAGLIPRLQQVGAQGIAPLYIASFRPGDRPLHALASAIIPLLEPQLSKTDQLRQTRQLTTDLRQDVGALRDAVEEIVKRNTSARLLLVADQFEELYTLCQDVEERQVFLTRLLEAANQTRNFNLVLTLRADFLGYALSYRPFADALQNADVKLGPMNRQELQDAVQKPAEKQGVKLEQGLTERILEAVGEEPGNLPLLEFALTQLWEKQSNGRLTHAAYDAIGGVEKALSNHADDVYAQLTDEEQKQVQKIFIQLVRPGEGTADTRRQATRAEVGEENWDLVKRLADERLVVSDCKKTTGEAQEETVEIVHEALIREWQRLRKWMKEDRAFRLWQERLRTAMRQWETTDKDDGALLRGSLLSEAEAWQQQRLAELSKEERVFIQLSLALRDRETDEREQMQQRELALVRQARSRLRWLVTVLSAIAFVSIGALAYPLILRWMAAGKMVTIPAGSAVVGTDDPLADPDERPSKKINLPTFKMEQFEVSNRQYGLCVEAGACDQPIDASQYNDPSKSNHPVVGVTAFQASTYCRWLGRRLPTQVEWERTARGSKGRRWPWGDEKPTLELANIPAGKYAASGTNPVNSHPKGKSPEGVFNLVGNVWEWTASYSQQIAQKYNEKSVWDGRPETLNSRLIIRGGSWEKGVARITYQNPAFRAFQSRSLGIRCVSN